jgi:hypothetical protein
MFPIIKNKPFAVDIVEHTIAPWAVEIVFRFRDDNEANFHLDALQNALRKPPPNLFLRGVKNDGQIEVAVGTVVSAGAGAEGDDLQRTGRGNYAAECFVDLFAGDGPINRDGLSGHLRFPDGILLRFRRAAMVFKIVSAVAVES